MYSVESQGLFIAYSSVSAAFQPSAGGIMCYLNKKKAQEPVNSTDMKGHPRLHIRMDS